MSRVRSQLDNLLDHPHTPVERDGRHRDGDPDAVQRKLETAWSGRPSANTAGMLDPAPRQAHAPNQQRNEAADLSRIRDSLDRLAGRLGSLGAPVPGAPVHGSARDGASRHPGDPQQHAARSRRQDAEQPSRPFSASPQFAPKRSDHALDGNVRDEMNALRREISVALEVFERARSFGAMDERSQDELHRLVDAVTRLEQQTRQAPDYWQDVTGELRNLHGELHGMIDHIQPGFEGLSRSIETNYADLAGRVEEMIASMLNQLPRSREDGELRGELAMLGEHVAAIRDAIDQLPGRIPVDQVEERLDRLAGSIEALADTEDRSLARHFGEIDSRLDEITRALVAVSTVPGESDSFDRIEARIATLAKTVEQIAEERQASAALPAAVTDGFAAEVKSALEAIDRRLGELGRGPSAQDDGYEAIAAHLATLSDKLDNMPSLNAVATSMAGDDELLARLDAIASRLDTFGGTPASGEGGVALESIERQLADLAGRFDIFASGGHQEAVDNGEVVAMLRDLAGRIDALAETKPAQLPATEQIERLENQLGGILSQLDTFSQTGLDFAPISERLDSIEQQVAHSRDIAIDVASQAAERAIGMVGGGSALEPELIESLRTELHDLSSSSRDVGARNVAAFETVHEALSVIVDRLGDIETRLGTNAGRPEPAGDVAPTPDPRDYASREDAEPVRASAGLRGDADVREQGSAAAFDDAGEIVGAPKDARTAGPSRAPGDDLPLVEDAPSVETEDQTQEEVEDVPLEPGSGTPDFASLVRQAAAKRKATDGHSAARETTDLISAARRAAQAAAEEAAVTGAAEKRKPEKKPREKKASGKAAALRKPLSRPAKLVLYLAAIAMLAIFAAPYAMKFFNRGTEVSSLAPAVQQEQAQPAGELTTAALGDRPVSNAGNERAATVPAATIGTDKTPIAATPVSSATVSSGVAPVAVEPVAATAEIPPPPEEVGNIALRQAAETGDGAALFEIARRYTDGNPVERDLAKAAQWYEYSARAGFAPAQYRLGNFFEKGHGVATDVDKAVLWYQRAAEQGNALAMHNLAVLYTSGLVEGKPDMETAVQWFHRAADLGVKDSQVNLGILYTRGMGVKEDLVEAYKWFAVAARAGDSDAATKRDMLANAMRPDQLEQARGLAGLWKPATIDTSVNSVIVKPEWTVDAGRRADATSGRAEDAGNATDPRMIEHAQALLSTLGFDAGPSDGVMGERTREAIRAFQRGAGMKVDGEVTGELIEALEKGAA
ncbi:MAG: SEL1-like repeat protein [Nitratireductor sp.]|nr:SEL1-like repeat protein [Nitratireductor sp.]